MRIAIVADTFPALTETFILSQVTGLMELGNEIDVYASRPRREAASVHPDVGRHELESRTRYWVSKRPADVLAGLGQGVRLLVRRPGAALRATARSASRQDKTPLRVAVATAGRHPYDVVLGHFGHNGRFGLEMRRLGLARQVLVAFHAYELSQSLTPATADEYRRMSLQGAVLLPVSERWRTLLLELRCAPEQVLVHRMGVDLDLYPLRERGPDVECRLLTVARLVEKKGVQYAVQAMAKLGARWPGHRARLTVIGDGPLRDSLQRLAGELGVADSVRFAGWRNQADVRREIYASHVMVLPSVTATDGDQEGIPVALMEAMATGMPVVSTSHSGIPELVEDGVSGLLAEERDADALADCIHRLASHPERWPAMGRSGRQRIKQEFNLHTLNRRLEALCRHLLEGGAAARFEHRTSELRPL